MAAFPDPRGADVRRRNFAHNALGDLSDLHVVERGGEVVAHAFLFHLDGWFGGRRVPLGAIASVGVAPEARGLGIARDLVERLHRVAHERGAAVTLLYPFRQGFYAALGYGAVTPTKRLDIAPRSIPRSWRAPAASLKPAVAAHRAAILAAYGRAAARTTGWLARPERTWEKVLLDERRRWTVLERGNRVAGYVAWELEQAEPHARTTVTVHELVADDDASRRALLGLFEGLRDQVHAVTLEVDADDSLDRALVDPDGHRHGTHVLEHTLGLLAAGPMVRVEDVARAIEARGYASGARGSFVAEIDLGSTRQSFAIGVDGGRARAEPASAAAALSMSRATLAAVLYGGLGVRQACALGLVESRDASALDTAHAAFHLPPFFALDRF